MEVTNENQKGENTPAKVTEDRGQPTADRTDLSGIESSEKDESKWSYKFDVFII